MLRGRPISEPSPWANGHSIEVLRQVAAGIVPGVANFTAEPVQCEVPGRLSVRAEWILANGVSTTAPIVVYFHGGAHLCGTPTEYRNVTVGISRTAEVRVLCVDYRLAPEHPYPAGFEDAATAYQWLVAKHSTAQPFILGGDSAGSAIAVSLAADLAQTKLPEAAGVFVNSPFVDLALASKSLDDPALNLGEPNKATIEWLVQTFLAGRVAAKDPRHSPVYRDLSTLPPLLVQVGGADNLHHDGLRLAQQARHSGVAVEFTRYANCPHIWPVLQPGTTSATARLALEQIARFIRRQLGSA